jgi:predicted Ser/Thr protein kinase
MTRPLRPGDVRPGDPLHPGDPRQLGGYQLLSRLGVGGMGTVYLARSAAGRLVAIKVVRPEFSDHDEFRARFRSEVNRVRQVPPFCTAEVIDADPDHRTPYLVVEYVDGPTLAEVVERQGPLVAGSLHSVAIGVATALAAIHSAGVIHRDLKPRNVLFALGTPKVIDFGIARALDVTSQHTGTDQMVGTVAYMAPERFDAGIQRLVSPAADIFAWGVIVTYAGTGRTPFAADSPAATAARILTQPPDLSGLTRPLRDLVALTLAKEPEDRPTAHELLDLLLAAGPPGAPTLAVDLAQRPELNRAAQAAQRSGRHATGGSGRFGRGRTAVHGQARPGRRRTALLVGAALLLVAAGAVAAPSAGRLLAGPADDAVLPSAVVSVAPTPRMPAASTPPVPRALRGPTVLDPLDRPGQWSADTSDGTAEHVPGTCTFDGQLVVTTRDANEYECAGPADIFAGEQSIAVDVTVDTQTTCALIWFRRTATGGYRLSLCPDVVRLDLDAGVGADAALGAAPSTLFQPGLRRRLLISADGPVATVTVAGTVIARFPIQDPSLVAGQVVLGVLAVRPEGSGRAMFAKIEIRSR